MWLCQELCVHLAPILSLLFMLAPANCCFLLYLFGIWAWQCGSALACLLYVSFCVCLCLCMCLQTQHVIMERNKNSAQMWAFIFTCVLTSQPSTWTLPLQFLPLPSIPFAVEPAKEAAERKQRLSHRLS